MHRHDVDAKRPIFIWVLRLTVRRNGAHLALRLRDGCRRLEPPEGKDETQIAHLHDFGRANRRGAQAVAAIEGQRHPEFVALIDRLKLRRQDADGCEAGPVEFNGLIKNIGVAGKLSPPECIAENDDARRARLIFAIAEDAPVARLDAERCKVVRGNECSLDVDRLAAATEVEIALRIGGNLLKCRTLLAVIQQIGYGLAVLHDIVAAVRAPDHDELLRCAIVERTQENGVDDAEDRRISTGAERQRDDGNEGESGLLAQSAQTITKILPQVFHNLPPARLVRMSKSDDRFDRASGICWRSC